MLRVLVNAGCPLEHQNSHGDNALATAIAFRRLENAALLRSLGALEPRSILARAFRNAYEIIASAVDLSMREYLGEEEDNMDDGIDFAFFGARF